MKALLYSDYERLEIAEQPDPQPRAGEAVIAVAAAGICGSELEAFKNRSPRRVPPLILGHEFCGIVTAVGPDVRGLKEGQRVVSHSLDSCGHCSRCRRGEINLCADRRIFGMHRPGAFAEFVVAPERCLIPWPGGVPAEAAALTEPLANGVHVVGQVSQTRPRAIAVIGAGTIGLMTQQAFQSLLGAEVIVGDLVAERLAVASRLGAKRVINSRREDFVETVRELTDGDGADVVVDAVGIGLTKKLSLAATRPGGQTVWIGTAENRIEIDSYEVTLPERHLHGSYAASMAELQTALDLITDGRVDASSWVTPFPLDQGVAAFEQMLAARGGDLKAVLRPQ
jgi:L-iditol 2-dehydrogenase